MDVAAYLLLVTAGWLAGLRSGVHRQRAWWLLAFAVLIPLAGVLMYTPIHWFARFYFIPYLIGPALLIGMATTFLQAAPHHGTRWAALAAAAIALFAGGSAWAEASRWVAIQRRDAMLVAFVVTPPTQIRFTSPCRESAFSIGGQPCGATAPPQVTVGHPLETWTARRPARKATHPDCSPQISTPAAT